MSKTKQRKIYSVKIRVCHKDTNIRMKPSFYEGLVAAVDPATAESKAIIYFKSQTYDKGVFYERFRVKPVRCDFFTFQDLDLKDNEKL